MHHFPPTVVPGAIEGVITPKEYVEIIEMQRRSYRGEPGGDFGPPRNALAQRIEEKRRGLPAGSLRCDRFPRQTIRHLEPVSN
jgi:hypothetical protein